MSYALDLFSFSVEEEEFFDKALLDPLLLQKLFAQIAKPGDPWPLLNNAAPQDPPDHDYKDAA